MAMPYWSVRFAVDASVARAVTDPLGALHRTYSEIRSIAIAMPRSDEPGAPYTVTFELRADGATNARVLGQHALGEAKAKARLATTPSPVLWVAPLAEGEDSSYRFLEAAESLMAEERYDLAVVAAQIHFEVHVRVLVGLARARETAAVAQVAIDQQWNWAPQGAQARRLLEAMLGVSPADFPGWKDYLAHVERRNDVVHEGRAIDEDSARESLRVVTAFWTWLNQAAIAAAVA